MCFAMPDTTMLAYLKTQVRVLELWREELAMQPDICIETLQRLEQHYHWLTSEVARLSDDDVQFAAPVGQTSRVFHAVS